MRFKGEQLCHFHITFLLNRGPLFFHLGVDPISEALSCPGRQTGGLKLFPNVKMADEHGVYQYTLKKCR